MRLYHTTTEKAWRKIVKSGLLCRLSAGRMPAVWLHDGSKIYWACAHFVRRHGGDISQMVTIELEVDASSLRTRGPGVWYSLSDIPPSAIRGITRYGVVSRQEVRAS